jgi:hypothetical protein
LSWLISGLTSVANWLLCGFSAANTGITTTAIKGIRFIQRDGLLVIFRILLSWKWNAIAKLKLKDIR